MTTGCPSWLAGAATGPVGRSQRGAALLAFLLAALLIGSGLLLERLNRAALALRADETTSDALATAKGALIAWAVANANEPGRLPWPDRDGDGRFDGISDCVTSGFANTHLIGRLPWLGEIVPADNAVYGGDSGSCPGAASTTTSVVGERITDRDGEPVWYAVSRNMLWNRDQDGAATDPPINPGLLDGANQYPWITVRDQTGQVISDRVAAVIIAPGPALRDSVRNQVRCTVDSSGQCADGGTLSGPSDYLDSVKVDKKIYDNSIGAVDGSNTTPTFIVYPDSRTTSSTVDSFNDRLVYITIDELMPLVEKRVAGEAGAALEVYRSTYGRYPWLSTYRKPDDASGGETTVGFADATSSDNKFYDYTAGVDFKALKDAGLIDKNDIIYNVTRRTSHVIKEIKDEHKLELTATHDFQGGDRYNVRPAFNGIWGERTGHIPFVDATSGEKYDVPTGFTASWASATGGAVTCIEDFWPEMMSLAPGECAGAVNPALASGAGLAPGGTYVVAAPSVPATGSSGVCGWTSIGAVDCEPGTATSYPYSVYVCVFYCTGEWATPLGPFLVTRTITYPLDFSGVGARVASGGAKTRTVISDAGTGTLTIQITDSVLGFTIGTTTVDVGPGNYSVAGIYMDPEESDFPAWLFTDLWHHYLYAAISSDEVAGGAASCASAGNCLTLDVAGSSVRNDVRALVVSAGAQLSGQDRSKDGAVSDYFESENADGIDAGNAAARGTITTTFNDQVRVVGPNPP